MESVVAVDFEFVGVDVAVADSIAPFREEVSKSSVEATNICGFPS